MENFGINPITKSPIKWDKSYSYNCHGNGYLYTATTYISEAIRIFTVDELMEYAKSCKENGVRNSNAILASCLNFKEQETLTESAIVDMRRVGITKEKEIPKRVDWRVGFPLVTDLDHISKDWSTIDPITGEILPYVHNIGYASGGVAIRFNELNEFGTHILTATNPYNDKEVTFLKSVMTGAGYDKIAMRFSLTLKD